MNIPQTTDWNGAFNDIGLVDLEIRSPMGTLDIGNLGPNDVAILLTPGNDGNVMEVVEGSTGQLLANKSYKVKNWSVTIRFLRHSKDYAKVTYLIQEILNGHITVVSLKFRNKNFSASGKNGQVDALNEQLTAGQAFLVNFAGLEAGAGASGDFEVTFKTSGAVYESGAYTSWSNKYSTEAMQDRGGEIQYAGTVDKYNKGEAALSLVDVQGTENDD